MSKDKETYQTISEKELLDYLEGKIKGARANQIERQILNSSFEEEALEGFSAFDAKYLRKDLSHLRSRLGARNSQKPGYLGIAATLAFLIAAFASLWFVMNNALPYNEMAFERTIEAKEEDNQNLALLYKDSAVEEVVAEEVNPSLATKSDTMQTLALAENVENDSEDTVAEEDLDIVSDLDQVASLEVEDTVIEEGLISESIEIAALTEPEADSFNDSAVTGSEVVAVNDGAGAAKRQLAAESLNAPTRAAAPAETQEEAPQSAIISGTVYYREDGEPLAGVKVTLNNTTTTTGLYGKFEIANDGNGEELEFTHPGTNPRRVGIEDTNEINVVMAPASSIQDVSIIGYGQEDRSSTIKSPVPKSGVEVFKEYVLSNLIYPQEARSQQVEGVVLVKLTVSSDGSINNVEVKKGLSQECDQEARRLVRNGPQWNPALYNGEPIEGSVRIRIPFKIAN